MPSATTLLQLFFCVLLRFVILNAEDQSFVKLLDNISSPLSSFFRNGADLETEKFKLFFQGEEKCCNFQLQLEKKEGAGHRVRQLAAERGQLLPALCVLP